MRVGIASDHGGFNLKEDLLELLRADRHEVVDFGADHLDAADDYPDFIIPLATAAAALSIERGIAVCGSGVGAAICANKVVGVRAAIVHDHFSARQGVEDDDMNVLCLGARVIGPYLAWDIVQAFLAANFSEAERHRRRLAKVAALEVRQFRQE
jgi:ribose 5-phosphate isomerase B